MDDRARLVSEWMESLDCDWTVMDWPKSWGLEIHDVRCDLRINDRCHRGRGVDLQEAVAFAKSLSESLEQLTFFELGLSTSSGLAVHETTQAARLNAICELVERDLILCHHYTKRPLQSVAFSRLADKTKSVIFGANNYLKRFKTALSISHTRDISGLITVICAVRGESAKKEFGAIVGSATSMQLDESVKSAVLECLRSVAAFEDGLFAPLSLLDFLSCKNPEGVTHERLALHPESLPSLEWLFQHRPQPLPQTKLDLESIVLEQLPFSKLVNEPPFVLIQATSRAFQELFLGRVRIGSLNLSRLSSFANADINSVQLNAFPHP